MFVVLVTVSAFMAGTPPNTSDSPAKIAKYIADNRDAIRWAAFVGAIGTIALFWFLGAVWRILRRAEGGAPRLAVVAVTGAVFAASMAGVAAIILSTLGIVGVAGSGGAAGTKFFYLLSVNIGVGTALGIAVFLGAFSAVILRTGVFPKALGWFGALIALDAVVATAGSVLDQRHDHRARTRRVSGLLAVGADHQRADAPRRRRRGRQLRNARAARVPRAGNASGRVPSARVTAFQVAAATAANTASEARPRGGPGSSTMSTWIGGVSFARRMPNERMVRSWISPVCRVDRQPFGEHPPQSHVRRADGVGAQHDGIERIARGDAYLDACRSRLARHSGRRAPAVAPLATATHESRSTPAARSSITRCSSGRRRPRRNAPSRRSARSASPTARSAGEVAGPGHGDARPLADLFDAVRPADGLLVRRDPAGHDAAHQQPAGVVPCRGRHRRPFRPEPHHVLAGEHHPDRATQPIGERARRLGHG